MWMLKFGGDYESKIFDKICCIFYFNIRYFGV